MKAKVFIGDKYLTKVNINKESDMPKLGDPFKVGAIDYHICNIEINYVPDYAIIITLRKTDY